jgi:HSP20 family protein
MNYDPEDMFLEMNAMMSRLMRDMNTGVRSDGTPIMGYHIVIHGGNVPPESPEPAVTPSRDYGEPVPEIHRIGDDVKVVVEMPGVSEENLNIRLDGQTLTIDAAGSIRTYHTHAEVPPVDPKSMQHSLKNGVLEVTMRALPEEKGQTENGAT